MTGSSLFNWKGSLSPVAVSFSREPVPAHLTQQKDAVQFAQRHRWVNRPEAKYRPIDVSVQLDAILSVVTDVSGSHVRQREEWTSPGNHNNLKLRPAGIPRAFRLRFPRLNPFALR